MKLISFYFFYVVIGVLIYFFGPMNYFGNNDIAMILYVAICYLSLAFGLFFGYKIIVFKKNELFTGDIIDDRSYGKVFSLSALITIFFNVVIIYTLYRNINASDIKELSLGAVYYLNIEREKDSGLITSLMTFFSPLSFISISLGVVLFKRLSIKRKIIFVLLLFSFVVSYLIKGTNFGIFILVINVIIPIYTYSFGNKVTVNKNIFNMLLILLFILVFLYALSSRIDIDYVPTTIGGVKVDINHVLFQVFPASLAVPITIACSYISQGYYAVSLMFDYNFTSTLGFGSGYFLLGKFSWLLGDDFFTNTYQYKMNELWAYRSQWHTAFVWLSNDFGYYSVFLLCFLFGFLTSAVYKDATRNKSIISTTLFSIIVIVLIFLPANNILMSNPLIFFSFYSLLIIWLFTSKVRIRC